MDKTSLGDRMKNNYENISRYYLTHRLPVIIRIDGKSFHTFTKHFEKPFDNIFVKTMQETMKCLCENIQGCVLGYAQSDEISLVLRNYTEINTDACTIIRQLGLLSDIIAKEEHELSSTTSK